MFLCIGFKNESILIVWRFDICDGKKCDIQAIFNQYIYKYTHEKI